MEASDGKEDTVSLSPVGNLLTTGAMQVDVGVMTREEADACISVEFNPVRARFAGSEDVWTRDILNLGVSPVAVIAQVRNRGLRPTAHS